MSMAQKHESYSDILIIGGGAAGLAAACAASSEGASVCVLEAGRKPAGKLLRTGGGRCNLLNAGELRGVYAGEDPRFAEKVLTSLPREECSRFFEELGVPLRNRDGWIYPYNEEAASVVSALLTKAEEQHVRIRNSERVLAVETVPDGFLARTKTWQYRSSALICACGSPAGLSKSEAEESGFPLLPGGHKLLPFVPGLCQMIVRDYPKELAGIRARALLTLTAEGTVLDRESGQVQFTEHGISGICAFNLALTAGAHLLAGEDVRVSCDFAPRDTETFPAGRLPEDISVEGVLPAKLYRTLFRNLPEGQQKTLLHACEFRIDALDTLRASQAARGGLLCREVDASTMMSLHVPGLFFAGEMLDIAGKCGGWNLLFAWSSGLLAGRSAAGYLASDRRIV